MFSACVRPLAGGASAAEACPNEARRAEQKSTYLPDCRGFELASPPLKNGQEVEPPAADQKQVPYQASIEGPGIAYLASGGLPGSESAGLFTQYFAHRSGSGWENLSLNPESRNEVIEGPGPH